MYDQEVAHEANLEVSFSPLLPNLRKASVTAEQLSFGWCSFCSPWQWGEKIVISCLSIHPHRTDLSSVSFLCFKINYTYSQGSLLPSQGLHEFWAWLRKDRIICFSLPVSSTSPSV